MRRKRTQPDSFGLLIDTMCNAIGGLVLIAVVVAILGSAAGPTEQRIENLNDRIEIGRDTLAELEKEQTGLENRLQNSTEEYSASDGVLLENEERIFASRSELEEIEEDLFRERRFLEELNQKTANLRGADPADLAREEFARAEEIDNRLRETRREITNLNKKIDRLEKASIREIQTPVESYPSQWHYVVVKGGRAYPFLGSEAVDPPREFFEVLAKSSTDIEFRPRGPGLSLEDSRLSSFITRARSIGGHCIIGVYPDSFEHFRGLREVIVGAGVKYGVDFFTEKGTLGFTSRSGEAIGGF